uniref:Sperm acrosome associated 6 n=1 Tax=Meleagris gallopavo TaxID=9103 RepID=A0A803XLF7_MELGA
MVLGSDCSTFSWCFQALSVFPLYAFTEVSAVKPGAGFRTYLFVSCFQILSVTHSYGNWGFCSVPWSGIFLCVAVSGIYTSAQNVKREQLSSRSIPTLRNERCLQTRSNSYRSRDRALQKLSPACIPPCGHQPAARIFQCSTCRLVDCQFPVDCPVQDVWVHEDEAVTLRCDVPFAVPPELQVTWMFAKDIRTQDLALFEELQRGAGEPPGLTVQDPTLGTIACRLGAASETLARKYFYLNGPPGDAAENLRSLPDPSDSRAPHGHQGPKGSVDSCGLTPGSFPRGPKHQQLLIVHCPWGVAETPGSLR